MVVMELEMLSDKECSKYWNKPLGLVGEDAVTPC